MHIVMPNAQRSGELNGIYLVSHNGMLFLHKYFLFEINIVIVLES